MEPAPLSRFSGRSHAGVPRAGWRGRARGSGAGAWAGRAGGCCRQARTTRCRAPECAAASSARAPSGPSRPRPRLRLRRSRRAITAPARRAPSRCAPCRCPCRGRSSCRMCRSSPSRASPRCTGWRGASASAAAAGTPPRPRRPPRRPATAATRAPTHRPTTDATAANLQGKRDLEPTAFRKCQSKRCTKGNVIEAIEGRARNTHRSAIPRGCRGSREVRSGQSANSCAATVRRRESARGPAGPATGRAAPARCRCGRAGWSARYTRTPGPTHAACRRRRARPARIAARRGWAWRRRSTRPRVPGGARCARAAATPQRTPAPPPRWCRRWRRSPRS